MPAPSGTVQRWLLSASQLAVMIGALVEVQPAGEVVVDEGLQQEVVVAPPCLSLDSDQTLLTSAP